MNAHPASIEGNRRELPAAWPAVAVATIERKRVT